MNVKIDTREKFHVITIQQEEMTGNMTEYLSGLFNKLRGNGVKNLILNMAEVKEVDDQMGMFLFSSQQTAYEQQQSFVICCLNPGVEAKLEKLEVLELMNTTPTESEAWDIVQMEEIERELLG